MVKKIFEDQSLNDTFSALDYEYEDMKDLMVDTARGTIQNFSKKEAEEEIRKMMFSVLELDPANINNKKLFKRAMKKNKNRLFEVIEDVVEDMLVQGWGNDPFFMQFVETRNLADGDSYEFWTEDEVNLVVSKLSGDHHNVMIQRLGEGSAFQVKANVYGAAVGTDIRLFLAGRRDWTALINAIYTAIDRKIKDSIYEDVMTAGEKLPENSTFNLAIPLDATNKEKLDQLISDVSAANDNSEVIIMGTDTALKKLGKLTDVDWISSGMKESMYETGKLGYYEGTALVPIPQRLMRKGGTIERMVATDRLLILPAGIDKFVKMVNVGDAEIIEITEQGDRMDDSMKFEYQASIGIGVLIGKYFGAVKITA